jgi:serine/threonine protein kinase
MIGVVAVTLVNLKQGDILAEKYEIAGILSSGEANTVYLCKEIESGALYAIKEIWGGKLPEEEKNIARETFDREIKVLRSLRHPGIPRFIDTFSVGIWHYLVMDFIKGKTLMTVLEEHDYPIPVRSAIRWGMKICEILNFLHNRASPIIFRNLSPSSIILTEKGEIRLIGFGLARFFDDLKAKDTHVLGTFGFAAPEQYGKKQTTPQTDIYSIGTTLYYLLTRENIQEFLFNFPSVRKFNSGVPVWLERVLARCLEKEPEKRYKDVNELKSQLEKGLSKP